MVFTAGPEVTRNVVAPEAVHVEAAARVGPDMNPFAWYPPPPPPVFCAPPAWEPGFWGPPADFGPPGAWYQPPPAPGYGEQHPGPPPGTRREEQC